jgi:hypothetical protein
MKLLCLLSLFILAGWKSTDQAFNEDENLESKLMEIKAKKLQKVLGEDAGMATNCWSKESEYKKETSEYDNDYPYSEDIDP